MENRELTMDDYLGMLRRRMKVILVPALLAPVAGFLVSYLFAPKFTSQSLVLVEGQKVPEGMVQPVSTTDISERIATLQQQVLSQSRLQPMLDRTGLVKPGQNVDDVIEGIRNGMTVEPVGTELSSSTTKKRPGQQGGEVPGFYVNYTAKSAREAQQICNELTSLMLEENLKSREEVARGTTDFMSKQVEDTKHNLDDLDAKLAAFKKQYLGQLPGDEDNNLKILMGLNSQLEANTQTLSRAQQDKSYTESVLAQQLTAWKNSQSSSNPVTLQQQLSLLQSQLIDLEARYTDDHPDVIKAKADIAQVKKKLAEVNNPPDDKTASASTGNTSASEPPEIRQLRLQLHQYEDLISQATRDQKRLQDEIANYQGRVALSPAVEEQYKQLARDYDSTQKMYQDLLANKSKSDITLRMEQQQEGEQMRLLNPASIPDAPSFPNRLFFAGGGLGAGLALSLGLALWLEMRDKSIRTQADLEAALELPMLVAVPWVPDADGSDGNGKRNYWKRGKQDEVARI
jgi:polysaccharide chain length determinant protein (PEP-CTERM system associated)